MSDECESTRHGGINLHIEPGDERWNSSFEYHTLFVICSKMQRRERFLDSGKCDFETTCTRTFETSQNQKLGDKLGMLREELKKPITTTRTSPKIYKVVNQPIFSDDVQGPAAKDEDPQCGWLRLINYCILKTRVSGFNKRNLECCLNKLSLNRKCNNLIHPEVMLFFYHEVLWLPTIL